LLSPSPPLPAGPNPLAQACLSFFWSLTLFWGWFRGLPCPLNPPPCLSCCLEAADSGYAMLKPTMNHASYRLYAYDPHETYETFFFKQRCFADKSPNTLFYTKLCTLWLNPIGKSHYRTKPSGSTPFLSLLP
jgi:hypothetical protein